MARKPQTFYYELTRKSPGPLRPGSIKAVIYSVMKRHRRAGEARIIDEVLADKDFRSRQDDPAAQVKWYLWEFSTKAGVLRRLPDRRYRSPREEDDDVRA